MDFDGGEPSTTQARKFSMQPNDLDAASVADIKS